MELFRTQLWHSWVVTRRGLAPGLSASGSSAFRGVRAGAADARPRYGASTKSLCRDLAAAAFATVMDPGPHPLDGTADVDQLLLGCGHERGDLCPLEGNRRPFGIMLVIAGGVRRALHDVGEVAPQSIASPQRPLPTLLEERQQVLRQARVHEPMVPGQRPAGPADLQTALDKRAEVLAIRSGSTAPAWPHRTARPSPPHWAPLQQTRVVPTTTLATSQVPPR